nr:putative gamma-glutamylcyclotransferase At3g02910 isoform X1 [Oryza sativa Japonica Group]XP_015616860.2 putative gamma-glutamylcyclotransferase At3g02910 isoform X1 [Oryza sativa Japonica Group]XP_015616861.2 putative gamma-glutamylcyclotransferase At3g02910 isoform X1 [Oryza sativa Japonica Group]XP_025877139.1 putative gamma-glutamylcyclotransferase At3g02910 isoform X1 [Oryza sativa Japonica Group]
MRSVQTPVEQKLSNGGGGVEAATMVFVYGTLKRGFPNHPLLAASGSPLVGAASTATPASLVVGPYSVPFLLPRPSSSSGSHLVSGELYAVSPRALVDLDALEGTHLGVYERRKVTVVVEGGSGEVVEAEAYFAHTSYMEALWLRCGGEAAEIGEYTMEHAAKDLDPQLQVALKGYLVARGVNSKLASSLHHHLVEKERWQYMNWLKTLEDMFSHHLVEKERWQYMNWLKTLEDMFSKDH